MKAEGTVPLGIPIREPAFAQTSLQPTSAGDLKEALPIIFDLRIQTTFGCSMHVTPEIDHQNVLASRGFKHTRVLKIGDDSNENSKVMRIGIIFDYLNDDSVTLNDLNKVHSIAPVVMLDMVLVIGLSQWSLDLIKDCESLTRVSIVHVSLDTQRPYHYFKGFVIPDKLSEQVAVEGNELIDSLFRQIGKFFHVVLADRAAPSYDQTYGSASIGTNMAMKFEENLLHDTIMNMNEKSLPIDIGCGTGRHTVELAGLFQKTIGYDFSRGMIDIADKKRAKLEAKKQLAVEFHVRDVEQYPIDQGDDTVDLFVASFGMGSFVEDLNSFISGLKKQLKNGGKFIISFYNREAIFYAVPPPWRDLSLSAVLDPDEEELVVSLSSTDCFRIFCRAYSLTEVKERLEDVFTKVKLRTCPVLSSFLPSNFFSGVNGKKSRWADH